MFDASKYNDGKVSEKHSLFLGDLSIYCDEKDIAAAFAPYGNIVDIRIQRSKETSRALSYGFIEFDTEESAAVALREMNYFLLKGRPLRYVVFTFRMIRFPPSSTDEKSQNSQNSLGCWPYHANQINHHASRLGGHGVCALPHLGR